MNNKIENMTFVASRFCVKKMAFLFLTILIVLFAASTVVGQSRQTIRMYGIAVPKDSVILKSAVDGHVEELLCYEGQFVRKGEVLVQLECSSARARLNIAKLQSEITGMLENAKAELEFAKSNFTRISSLFQDNASHVREYHQAKLRLENALAAVKIQMEERAANQARYELAKAELEDYFLRAPFDGYVVLVQTGKGESVSDQNELIRVVSLDTFRVELYLPVDQANLLQIGQMVPAQIRKPFEKDVEARVVFRSPLIEAATGTTRVVVEIDNRNLKLPAGFTVSLSTAPAKIKTAGYPSK